MGTLSILLYVVAGLEALGGLSYIPLVGQTRTYTAGPVVALVVLSAFAAVVVTLAAVRL